MTIIISDTAKVVLPDLDGLCLEGFVHKVTC